MTDRYSYRWLGLVPVLAVAACATGLPERAPERVNAIAVVDERVNDVPVNWQAGAPGGTQPGGTQPGGTQPGGTQPGGTQDVADGWIEGFDAPALTALVNEALSSNSNLRAAALNVQRSWLLSAQAGAARVPQINASAGVAGQGVLEGGSSPTALSIGAQASWEVDLWGRLRSGQRSAVAGAQASEADFRSARLSIVASVARAWVAAISAEQQIDISEKIVDALSTTRRIVGIRLREGLATAQDFAVAAANLASAQDTLVSARGARNSALRMIEALIGRYPGNDLVVAEVLPQLPSAPRLGLPSALLERRPDLISAERRIAAAFDATDQARAARLPSLSLTASVGGASAELGQILNPANVAWNAAANLLAPIFDGGRRRIQVDIATVDQRLALESYVDAALNAFLEVEQALDAGDILRQRKVFLARASEQSDEALRLARLQYEEGEIDLLSVIQLEQSAFAARSNVLTVNRLALEQYINLCLALGGHWAQAGADVN